MFTLICSEDKLAAMFTLRNRRSQVSHDAGAYMVLGLVCLFRIWPADEVAGAIPRLTLRHAAGEVTYAMIWSFRPTPCFRLEEIRTKQDQQEPKSFDHPPMTSSAALHMAGFQANSMSADFTAANITTLPLELLWEIVTYLPVSSRTALKLTSKALLLTVPTPPRDWDQKASRCERKARRRYVNEGREIAAGRRRCVNCDLVTYAGRFPTAAPLCKWHEPRFMSNSIPGNLDPAIKTSLLGLAREYGGPSWIAFNRMYCAHKREVIGWHEADCGCECDSCGHFPVPCFVRLPSKRDTRHWRSSKLTEDGLFVDEEHWVDSPGKSLGAYQQTVPIIQLDVLNDRVRQS